MQPISFDNAATGFPKPAAVQEAVLRAMQTAGNPGRGGHPLAEAGGAMVYHARETAAGMFGASPENVVFTGSCTHALNLAIQGTLRQGDHVIITDLEHNSVWRPVYALAAAGRITYSIAHIPPETARIPDAIAQHIRKNTAAVIMTLVSNVTGQILPHRTIAEMCRSHGIRLIADGAQGCGVIPVSLADGIQILCTAGHKGLYGPMGTGLLLTDGTVPITPLTQGGTGSRSQSPQQPDYLPDALESGTLNVSGIAGLDAGMQFIMQKGLRTVFAHEAALCERFLSHLRAIPDAVIYRQPSADYAPVISFRLMRETPQETAARLAEAGICMRAGLHCAPLAHTALGTSADGTVRFAPSVFSTAAQTDRAGSVIA